MTAANLMPHPIPVSAPSLDLAAHAREAADLARRAEAAEAEAAEAWRRYAALVRCVECSGLFDDAAIIDGGRCERCLGQDGLAPLRRERDDLGRLLLRADALIAELLLVAAPRSAQTAESWINDSRTAIAAARDRP